MFRSMRLIAALLLGLPQATLAAWTASDGAALVEQTTQRSWTEDFTTTLGDGTTLDVSACATTTLISFDASVGDASADARIQTFSCQSATQATGLCTELQRQPGPDGTVPSQFTDVSMAVPGKFFRYVKRAGTTGGDTARVTVECDIASVGGVAGTAEELSYAPSVEAEPEWEATCAGPLVFASDYLDCVGENFARRDELASVSVSDIAPVAACSTTGGTPCMHLVVVDGVPAGLYCAEDGEDFGPCTPGFSSGAGTASPIGNVACAETVCSYFESDAAIWWVTSTPGDAGWLSLNTSKLRREFRYFMQNWDTATDSGRCMSLAAGSAPSACTTTTGYGLHLHGHYLPRVGDTRLKRIACSLTSFATPEAGDDVIVQVQERNGVDPVHILTASLTIPGTTATGSATVVTANVDEAFTLTGNVEVELKVSSSADANNSITDLDFTWCDIVMEFGS